MKKLGFIIMVCALMLGASQCKKTDVANKPDISVESVFITLNVGCSTRANIVPEDDIAPVYYVEGDMIHVVSDGKYIGTLTYNGSNFNGDITNPTEGQPLHFYFLGNVTPVETLEVGETSSCSVVISDQTTSHPVISYAPSDRNYSVGTINYTTTLLNKCALVKFDVTTASEAATCIMGMNNKVTVDFETNEFAYSQEGDGGITLSAGSGERWAILLPQDAIGEGENGSVYSEDGACGGIRPAIPAITENGYLNNGIDITLENQILPCVITAEVTSITINTNGNSAIVGGEVISQGGSEVTQRGICWSISSNPGLSDNVVSENLGLGSYSFTVTGIELGNTYYVRAFATNQFGTAYGEEVSFTVDVGALYEFEDGSSGIVFYIDDGQHGLVVSLDGGYAKWSTNTVDIPSIPDSYPAPTSFTMGLGASYTTTMINYYNNVLHLSVSNYLPAAYWCRSKGSEWYLPSFGELHQLSSVRTTVNNGLTQHGGSEIRASRYWSSSEYNSDAAWRYNFGGSWDQTGWSKPVEHNVRAVRMF
jgi:hypothetical protein